MQVSAEPFVQALAIAVSAALLAAIYPALKSAGCGRLEALRSE
jgi:ABC-type lipoprotein release transport system permease subunit